MQTKENHQHHASLVFVVFSLHIKENRCYHDHLLPFLFGSLALVVFNLKLFTFFSFFNEFCGAISSSGLRSFIFMYYLQYFKIWSKQVKRFIMNSRVFYLAKLKLGWQSSTQAWANLRMYFLHQAKPKQTKACLKSANYYFTHLITMAVIKFLHTYIYDKLCLISMGVVQSRKRILPVSAAEQLELGKLFHWFQLSFPQEHP